MISAIQIKEDIKTLDISSSAFVHKNYIPKKYTCDGENVNPSLSIKNLPNKTKSLVIIVDDPDASVRTWTHWLVWNVPPTHKIKENSKPGTEGVTDFREQKYNGPCPPSGLHHYHFKIYALDSLLYLNHKATKHDVEKEMSSHILAFGEIVGLYTRETIT